MCVTFLLAGGWCFVCERGCPRRDATQGDPRLKHIVSSFKQWWDSQTGGFSSDNSLSYESPFLDLRSVRRGRPDHVCKMKPLVQIAGGVHSAG
jgi:hypothetical protein